jgi:nucleoside-diphosphate-sugar epimerase
VSQKRILVTGGFGYVGSRLTPALLEKGYAVRVLDLNLYGDVGLEALQRHKLFSSWRDRFEFVRADLRDPEALDRATRNRDVIIHLAAISNDPTGQLDEVLTKQVNFDAVGMLLSTARKNGVSRFINASSSSVFGIKNEENVTEELEPEPITFYSKYKMLSEWLVRAADAPGFVAVSIRPATICGHSPRQRFDLTVNKLTADAVQKGRITVHGGEQRRPNVGMTDMLNIYTQLVEADAERIRGQVFNFGFENLKVIEIAKLIQAELRDLNPPIDISDSLDKRDYHISSKKIVSQLGYKPVSSIANEVSELRREIENGAYGDIEGPQWHNMRAMKLERNRECYSFLAR